MEINFTIKADSGEVQNACNTANNFVNAMAHNDAQLAANEQDSIKAQNAGNVIKAIFDGFQPLMPLLKGILEKKAGLIPLNGKNFVEQKDLTKMVAEVIFKAFPYLMEQWEKEKSESESEDAPESTEQTDSADAKSSEQPTDSQVVSK